ncbi:hypothetical protein F5Y11DRAFT_318366 [Daldinia sp. FL1419]|nr:hypothetical protein F5Y11DRAFT_318366 [Daldinia sp. FL1419]
MFVTESTRDYTHVEIYVPRKIDMASRGNLTPRTIMAPAAAFTMACVLFAYTRSSIKEARRNAQHERDQRRNHPGGQNSRGGGGGGGGGE